MISGYKLLCYMAMSVKLLYVLPNSVIKSICLPNLSFFFYHFYFICGKEVLLSFSCKTYMCIMKERAKLVWIKRIYKSIQRISLVTVDCYNIVLLSVKILVGGYLFI